MPSPQQNFPPPSTPIAGQFTVNQNWMQFFLALYKRTGQALGMLAPVQVGYTQPTGNSPITAPIGVLDTVAAKTLLANTAAVEGIPQPQGLSTVLDALAGKDIGSLLMRGESGWALLEPGDDGTVLTAHGAQTPLDYRSVAGLLPTISDGTLLANISGAPAQPIEETLSAVMDYVFGAVQGDLLFRGATGWQILAPGTSGQVLETGGAAANPSWATIVVPGGFGFFFTGLLTDGELCGSAVWPQGMQFSNSDPKTIVECRVPPFASCSMNIQEMALTPTPSPVTVGTISFTPGSYTGTVNWLSSPYTLTSGKMLQLVGSSPRDVMLSFVGGNLNGVPQ